MTEQLPFDPQSVCGMLLEQVPSAIALVQDAKFVFVNEAFNALMQRSTDELIGRPFAEIISPKNREMMADYYRRRAAGEVVPAEYDVHALRPDGSLRSWHLNIKLVTVQGKPASLISVLDVTDRVQLEQQFQQTIERRSQQVQVSTEVAQQIAAATNLDEIFSRVVTLTKERFGYYHTQLLRYDQQQDAVVLVAGYGKVGAKMLKAGHQLPMGSGLIGTAVATGNTVMRADLADDPDWQPNLLLPDTRGEMAVPIKWENEVLGVLDIQAEQKNMLTDEDRFLLEGLCGQIAIAIHSANLLEEAALFRQVAQQAGQGIAIANLDATLRYANQSLARLFGADSYNDIAGERITNFYPPEEQNRINGEILPQVMQTGSWTGEITVCSVTGENQIPTINNVFLVRDVEGQPRYIANVVSDISLLRQAEQAIDTLAKERVTTERLRAVVNASYELMRVPDLDTLYRQVIEVAHTRLGIERCGLFILDEAGENLIGMYGTNDQGDTVDQRAETNIIPVTNELESNLLASATDKLSTVFYKERILIRDGQPHELGLGWNAATVLLGPAGPRGILYNDAAISNTPYDETLQETLAIYCSVVANIIENKRLVESIRESLAQQDLRVQTSTMVAQEIAATYDLDTLLQRVVDLTKEHFDYYHTQILRYDPTQDAVVLVTSYGEVGKAMLAAGHRLPMGAGLIGTAAATGETVIRSTLADDPDWQPNPLLLETKGEIAVPIKLGDKVLGVLDVQSAQAGALADEDRLLLEGLCGQLAIAMHSAELVETVRESELRYQQILDAITDMVLVKGPKSSIIWANKSFRDYYGMTNEQLRDLIDAPIVEPDYTLQYIKDDAYVFESGKVLQIPDEPVTRYDGTVRPFETVKSPIRDLDGKIVMTVGVSRDITERKQERERIEKVVEERTAQLRESEQRIRSILDALPMGMHIYRLEEDGRLMFTGANPAGDRLLGVENSIFVGKTIEAAFPPLAETEIPARYRAVATDGVSWQTQQFTYQEGEIKQVFEVYAFQTTPGNMVAAFLDVTQRVKTENALQQEKVFSDTLINSLPGIFYLVDPAGKIVRWNRNYEELLGRAPDGMDAFEDVAEEDRGVLGVAMQQLEKEGRAEVEVRLANYLGKEISFYLQGKAMQIGDQTYIVGTGIDMTERKQLEAQIQQSLVRRGRQVQLSTQIAQNIASAASLDELYNQVVSDVKEQFGYYHVQLLRYDPALDAVTLIVGYGEIGRKMLAAGHRLPMGSGLIGAAAATGETMLRPDLADDPDWHPNPLLPETKGEIAVPIKWQNDVLGVLDVQVDRTDTLTDEDRLLLEGLCGQIAIAIHSTNLLEEAISFRQVAEQASQGIGIASLEGNLTFCNQPMAEMFGATKPAEILGENIRNFYPPEAQELLAQTVLPTVTQMGSWLGEISVCSVTGENVVPTLNNVFLVRDAEGSPRYIATIVTDITQRKLAEEALRNSEAQLSEALRIARLGNWEYDFGTDTFTFNDNFYQVFRTTVEEVGGYQMRSEEYARRFVHPDDVSLVGSEIARALSDTAAHFTTQVEHRAIFPSGEMGYISVTVNVERDEAGQIIRWHGANQDITERRQVQENIERLVEERTRQLRESQQLLQLIMDNIPQAVFWKDKDLIYLGANQAFAKDAGFNSANEITGKTDFDMPWVEQAELYRADDRRVIEEGTVKLNYEEPQTGPTNEVTWLRTSKIPVRDENKNVIAVLGMYEDITERMKIDAELRRLQIAVEQTDNGIALADMEGNLTYVNPAWAQMHGYTVAEILNKHLAMFHTPEQLQQEVQPFMALAAAQGTASAEVGHVHKDGHTFPTLMSSTVLLDGTGKAIGLLGTARDITERIRLEQQVQQSLVRRGRQVQLSTQIAQNIASAASLDELYNQVVSDVKEQFGYYHVQLLRYDPALDAVTLIVGYGEIGRKMLAAGHRLPMGSGLIGTAAATGETMLRPDLADDPDWHPNPLLPETRGEIAVPIKLGERVMGVLDVQSDRVGALSVEDRQLLEGLCGQIAVAIDQTRLRAEMEERLDEINILYRTVSGQGWQAFQETGEFERNYYFNRSEVKPGEAAWTDGLDQVFEQARVTHLANDRPATVAPLMVRGGNIIGALGVADDPEHPISADEMILLEQVSEQLALALDSARLFSQTQASLAETQSLYRFNEAISSEMELDAVYQTVARLLGAELGFSGCWVAVYDPDENLLRGVAGVNMPEERITGSVSLNEKMPATFAAQTRRVAIVNDPSRDDRMSEVPPDVRSVMGKAFSVPIMIGQELFGVISVTRPEDGADFGAREERLLQAIATQMAIAAQRAQLFAQTQVALEETRRRTQEMAVLNEMGRVLTSLRDVEAIADVIHQYTSRLMEAETFFVALYDDATKMISFPLLVDLGKRVSLSPQQLAGGLTEYIVRTKRPLLLADHVAEQMETLGIENIELGESHPTKSWMGVPMIYGDQVIGVISVQSPTQEGVYKEFDRDLLTSIASQAAISIENARIFERTQRQAEYEALINTISQRIQSTTSVENALQVAVRELGRALGASRASVQLGVTKRKA